MTTVEEQFKGKITEQPLWSGDKPDKSLKTAAEPISSNDAKNEEEISLGSIVRIDRGKKKTKNKEKDLSTETSVSSTENDDNFLKNVCEKIMFFKYVFLPSDEDELPILSRHFLFYVFYLFVLIVASNGSQSDSYDYCKNVLSNEITDSYFPTRLGYRKKFEDILIAYEIWEFLAGPFLKILYSHDSDPMKSEKHSAYKRAAVQVRQVKVKNDTCSTASMFADMYSSCYDFYTIETEETRIIREGSSVGKYVYDDDKVRWTGAFSTYSKGGYSVNLTHDQFFTEDWLKNLSNDTWIDIQTRAVFVDTAIYTPNVNHLCVAKLIFEILPCGAVVPSAYFQSGKLFGYLNPWDFVVLSCEIVLTVLTAYLIVSIIVVAYRVRTHFFRSWINLLDVIIVFLASLVIITGNLLVADRDDKGVEFSMYLTTNVHVSFDKFLISDFRFRIISSLLIVFIALRLCTFSRINECTHFISLSFVRIKMELIALLGMTLLVTTAFSIMGVVLFGHVSRDFHTLGRSMFSLLTVFTDGFNFFEYFLLEYSVAGAYIFFALYFLLVKLMATGSFVALVVYGFYRTSEDWTVMEVVYLEDVGFSLLTSLLLCLGKGRAADKVIVDRETRRNKDKYDALSRIFKAKGWTNMEIRLLMSKHRLTRGDNVSVDRMSEIYDDFCLRNRLMAEVGAHAQLITDLEQVQRSIEYCNSIITDVTSKTVILADVLLTKKK